MTTPTRPGPLLPTFDESLQSYFKRCGANESDAAAVASLHAFWHACLSAQYAQWKTHCPFRGWEAEKDEQAALDAWRRPKKKSERSRA